MPPGGDVHQHRRTARRVVARAGRGPPWPSSGGRLPPRSRRTPPSSATNTRPPATNTTPEPWRPATYPLEVGTVSSAPIRVAGEVDQDDPPVRRAKAWSSPWYREPHAVRAAAAEDLVRRPELHRLVGPRPGRGRTPPCSPRSRTTPPATGTALYGSWDWMSTSLRAPVSRSRSVHLGSPSAEQERRAGLHGQHRPDRQRGRRRRSRWWSPDGGWSWSTPASLAAPVAAVAQHEAQPHHARRVRLRRRRCDGGCGRRRPPRRAPAARPAARRRGPRPGGEGQGRAGPAVTSRPGAGPPGPSMAPPSTTRVWPVTQDARSLAR